MTKQEKIDLLAEAFTAGLKAAEAAATANQDDGGTCNLDSAVFWLKGARESLVLEAAEKAGVIVNSFTWLGARCWWVNVQHGQANLRARMAQAAAQAMRAFNDKIPGFRASCYQAMD